MDERKALACASGWLRCSFYLTSAATPHPHAAALHFGNATSRPGAAAAVSRGISRSWRAARRGVFIDQPDVAEVDRVAVVLEEDRQRIRSLDRAASRFVLQLQIVVNDDAVVSDCDATLFRSLPIGIKLRCSEVDVVCLPTERRKAYVQVGGLEAVERCAVVELQFEAERIEHLDLVPFLQIETTVSASLSLRVRHVGRAEFGVKGEVLHRVFRLAPDFEQPVRRDLRVLQTVGVLTVEQDDGICGGNGSGSEAVAVHGGQVANDTSRRVLHGRGVSLLEFDCLPFARQYGLVSRALATQFDSRRTVVAVTRQTARIPERVELPVSQGHDLQSHGSAPAVRARHVPRVLTLNVKVRIDMSQIGHALLQILGERDCY